MTDEADPPEPRRRPWDVVRPGNPLSRVYLLTMLFALGSSSLHFLLPPYLDERGASFTQVGTAASVYAFATLLARLPAGALYQPERVTQMVVAAGVASSVAFLLVTMTSNVYVVVVLMAVDGISWGVVMTLLLAIVLASRPTDTSASALMGWYVGFLGLGHALAGVTGGMLGDLLGIRGGMLALAGLPLLATLTLGPGLPRVAVAADAERADTPAAPAPSLRPAMFLARWRLTISAMPLAVWVAAVAGLYLNVMGGLLVTFFPILALSLGFTLSQAGGLASIRSGVSALARFGSIPLFERVPASRLRIPLMFVVAITTMLVPVTGIFLLQIPIWMLSGAGRGLVRVGTGAEAMDALADGQEGLAAALMSAGMDLGKVIGPLLGGVVADRLGTVWAFTLVPPAFLFVFLVLEMLQRLGPGRRASTA